MAFVLRFGFYKLTVLSFGLCNALITFQRLMSYVISNIKDQYVLVYPDDILVYSKVANNHAKHLSEVFLWLCTHKLQEKHAKCEFGRT